MQEQKFSIADIIGLITGADFGFGTQGPCEVASFLLETTVTDQELDGVRRACTMALRQQHEGLTFILHPRRFGTIEDALGFLDRMTEVHGYYLAIMPVKYLPPVKKPAPAAH